jgi:hypothetical protein
MVRSFFWQNSEIRGDGLEGWPADGRAGANFRELMRSNQVQQMKRLFTRHVQRSGRAYPGRLVHPIIWSDQTQTEIRPVCTRPEGLLVDSATALFENTRLQGLLQQCDWDGRF